MGSVSQRGQIPIQDGGVYGARGLVRNRALTPVTLWPETDLSSATSACDAWIAARGRNDNDFVIPAPEPGSSRMA
jgi:hypothetical protein